MLKVVQKQLKDFLEGGQFSSMPSKASLKRTSFAQVTNLACEHHFSHLDSSQRKRPNASFHHHSSVQMLKRNRCQLIYWINEMPEEEQTALLKTARKEGLDLRRKHREEEESVREEILNIMTKDKKQTMKRRKLVDRDGDF